MCGICGVIQLREGAPVPRELAERMQARLAHRGPDDGGAYVDGWAALGHTRLAIVDPAGGRQPMSNEDGSLWIVYNGEIYNHLELRSHLVSRGHRYQTESDTETILHLYEEEGEACVERLRGMFAFAIWDAARRQLFLARDRMGIKPLYIHQDADRLRFASEIKALLVDPEVEPRLNGEALPEHLAFGYFHDDTTLFAGVRSLPPGHTLTVASGRVVVRQYWDFPINDAKVSPRRHGDTERIVREFRALFEDAVRSHLMSDVPLGLFLSGGIDSTAIAAVMSRFVAGPLRTFSIGFEEAGFDEFEYAREAARRFGTEHHETVLDASGFRDSLAEAIRSHDTPICFPAAVPLYHLSRLAARHVKVVLTGEGSDELLAGYGRTAATCWNARLGGVWRRWSPSGVRSHWVPAVVDALPAGSGADVGTPRRPVAPRPGSALGSAASRWARLARRSFLADASPEGWRRLHWEGFYATFGREARAELLGSAAFAEGDPCRVANAWLEKVSHRPVLEQLLYADTKGYLIELLMKQDKMSMAASIESRVPFLDPRLVAFCAGVPPSLKLRGFTGKVLLRRAMEREVPARILRRPKQGFPVPLATWLRGAWRDFAGDVLLDRTARQRGLFDAAVVERLLVEHASGKQDHAGKIWMLLNLELWQREFLDGARCPGRSVDPRPGARLGTEEKTDRFPIRPGTGHRAPGTGAKRP
jgi:asparagine synthase (glutamine-hydrolysing)